MLSDGGFNGIARCEDEHDLESKHIFEDLFQIPFRWGFCCCDGSTGSVRNFILILIVICWSHWSWLWRKWRSWEFWNCGDTFLMMTLMPKTITMELLGVVVVLCGSGKHLEGPRWLTAIGQQGDDVQEYCKDKVNDVLLIGNSGCNANHLGQWNKVRCSVSSWRAIRCYLT